VVAMPLIVRLYTTAGRARITCDGPQETLDTFRERVQKQTGVAKEQQTLSLKADGSDVLSSPGTTPLSGCGFSNGVEVWLASKEATITGNAPIAAKAMKLDDLPDEKEAKKKEEAETAAAEKDPFFDQANKSKSKMTLSDLKPEPKAKAAEEADKKDGEEKDPFFDQANKPKKNEMRLDDLPPEKRKGLVDKKSDRKTFEQFLLERAYEVGTLAGNSSYKPVYVGDKGRMTKMPPSLTLQRQVYRHVDILIFQNIPEMQEFCRYWRFDLHQAEQRCGWIYGYYLEDAGYEGGGIRAVMEGIYEPPQTNGPNGPTPLPDDKFLEDVDKMAERLGLERLGYIFTSWTREGDSIIMPTDLPGIAKNQLANVKDTHYSGYELSKFVTCLVSPDPTQDFAPKQDVVMVSDQCMAMVRDGLLEPAQGEDQVVLRKAEKNEALPNVLESAKRVDKWDVDWHVVRVWWGAPKRKDRTIFKHSHFPRENRSAPQTRADVKGYFRKVSTSEPIWQQVSDFHLLLWVAKEIDLGTALSLCDCISQQKDPDPIILSLIQGQ